MRALHESHAWADTPAKARIHLITTRGTSAQTNEVSEHALARLHAYFRDYSVRDLYELFRYLDPTAPLTLDDFQRTELPLEVVFVNSGGSKAVFQIRFQTEQGPRSRISFSMVLSEPWSEISEREILFTKFMIALQKELDERGITFAHMARMPLLGPVFTDGGRITAFFSQFVDGSGIDELRDRGEFREQHRQAIATFFILACLCAEGMPTDFHDGNFLYDALAEIMYVLDPGKGREFSIGQALTILMDYIGIFDDRNPYMIKNQFFFSALHEVFDTVPRDYVRASALNRGILYWYHDMILSVLQRRGEAHHLAQVLFEIDHALGVLIAKSPTNFRMRESANRLRVRMSAYLHHAGEEHAALAEKLKEYNDRLRDPLRCP